jgi:transposase-like protein
MTIGSRLPDESARTPKTAGHWDLVSLGTRRHGIAPTQMFRWRRLYIEGALSAMGADKEVARSRSCAGQRP